MKKALIIANMLFASATVFGAVFDQSEIRRAEENSLLTLVTDDVYRAQLQRVEEAETERAIENSLQTKKAESEKIVNNKFDESFLDVLNASTLEDLSKFPNLINSGEYTLWTLHMLKNPGMYTFVQYSYGSLLNGLDNQCAILALDVDESTMNKIQQLKVPTGNSGILPFAVEDADGLDGSFTTLGKHIAPRGGLSSDEKNIWETIAEMLGYRIDIFEHPTGEDPSNESIYHDGGLYSITSYGVRFDEVKRLALHSTITRDFEGKLLVLGHYTELRVFNKDGSQVE